MTRVLRGVEFREEDIVTGPVDPGCFDFVTARAVLHHVSNAEAAIDNLVGSLRPGGIILLVEPDFLPVSVAEPIEIRTFWNGWLTWSRERGIDYHIGRTLAPRLAAHGLKEIGGAAQTALYNGGSPWADYWRQTITELRSDLVQSGKLDDVHRGVPRSLRRPELVDTDNRIYRRSRACAGVRSLKALNGESDLE